jgi:hypothetical protein
MSRASLNPLATLQQLPSLALSRESDRKEVAERLLRKVPEELLRSLNRIGIEDPDFAFKVARGAIEGSATTTWYASSVQERSVPEYIGSLNLSDEQKLKILSTALKYRPHELPAYTQNIRPEDPDLRFKFACTWADSEARSTTSPHQLLPLSTEWIPDEKLRAEVAKIAVSNAPHHSELFIKEANLTSPTLLHEVLHRAVTSPGHFNYHALKALSVCDETSLVELCEAGAHFNPVWALSQLKDLHIQNKEALHGIVEVAANSNRLSRTELQPFINAIGALKIEDQPALQRVAHSLARFGWMDRFSLSILGVSTREDTLTLATLAAHRAGPPPFEKLKNLGLLDPSDTLRVAIYASAHHPVAVAARTKLDYPNLDAAYKATVYRTIVGQNTQGISALLTARIASPQKVISEIIVPALRTAQTVWAQDRGTYSVRVVENILDGILDNAKILGLEPPAHAHQASFCARISHALQTIEAKFPDLRLGATAQIPEGDALSKEAALLVAATHIATASLAADSDRAHRPLALVAGLNGLENQPLGPREYRKLVELLRSIYDGPTDHHPNLGALVDISSDAWSVDFAGAFDCVLCRAALHSIDSAILPQRLTIDPSNMTEQKRIIEAALNKEFASQLNLSSAGDAVTLAKAWGDLTPITVLLGRFARSHAYEIPALQEVVEHVIKGTFFNYRYDIARGQLLGFSPAMIEQWRTNPHRLTLCRAGESSEISTDLALVAAQRNYAQLLLHLSHVADLGAVGERCSGETARHLAQAKQETFASHYREMEKERSGAALEHIIGGIGALLREGDRASASLFLRNFATIKAQLGTHIPQELRSQLFDDLNAIAQAVKERTVDKGKGYVLFTTLTDDPKLMMTVGDLVNTSSCQNFRTGSVVQTLLGYVTDGNIKASLTFAIAEGNLRNLFKISHKEPFDPSRYTVSFDAPKLLLKLTDPDGTSHTVCLGKAIRRRIIRVGQREEDSHPAMFAERPYEILHAVTPQMEAEEAALLHAVEKDCGFRPAVGTLKFPASSNPAGVYSDYGQGAMVGDYIFGLPAR